jgi:Tfp pilus assembly protein PilV
MTIVEVIVALMLLTIGLLGIAGSSTLAFQATHDILRRRAALASATQREARLRGTGCSQNSANSATDSRTAITERWTVVIRGTFAELEDSVSWRTSRGDASLVFRSAFQC